MIIICANTHQVPLFVHPRIHSLGPVIHALGEPHGQFVRGTVRAVRPVTNVATQIYGKVAANRPGLGGQRLRLTEHLSALLDNVFAFPAHADDRTRAEKVDKTGKKGFLAQIGVVLFGHLLGRPHHFQTDQLVAALFETGDNVPHEAPLDAVGFDGEKGALLIGAGLAVDGEGLATGGRSRQGTSSRRGNEGHTGGQSRNVQRRTSRRGSHDSLMESDLE